MAITPEMMADKVNDILEAVKAYLDTQEIIESPEEARLLLAFYEYEPSILTGKELCSCDDSTDCDECWTVEQKLEWLRDLANK